MKTTSVVWIDLRNRYYHGDIFRICALQEEIHIHMQGDASITAYYTYLKGPWEELNDFKPIPSYTCVVPCTYQLIPTFVSYREIEYLSRFLKGLHEQYSAIRSQIMLIRPLLDIAGAFALLIRQEKRMKAECEEVRIMMNVTETQGKGRGNNGRRGNRGGKNSRGKGRGKGNKVCSYRDKTGHTIDTCYKKHGYPPNYF